MTPSRTIWVVILALTAHSHAPAQQLELHPAAAEVLEQIEGKEQLPAGEVFANVQYLKDVPAGVLLRIMDIGYSRGLGVECDHCHIPGRWESDEKRPKRAAREMQTLMRDINQTLRTLQNLESEKPGINCSTCHRGSVRPWTGSMPPIAPK